MGGESLPLAATSAKSSAVFRHPFPGELSRWAALGKRASYSKRIKDYEFILIIKKY